SSTNEQVLGALSESFAWIVPEMILGVAACALFVGGTFRTSRSLWAGISLAALAAAGLALWLTFPNSFVHPPGEVFGSALLMDPLGILVKAIAILGGIVLVLLSWEEVPDRQAAEYHGCLLVIVAGLCLTGVANDLVTLFLALELISIPTYI